MSQQCLWFLCQSVCLTDTVIIYQITVLLKSCILYIIELSAHRKIESTVFREGPGHRHMGLSQQITTFVQTFSLFKPVPSPF